LILDLCFRPALSHGWLPRARMGRSSRLLWRQVEGRLKFAGRSDVVHLFI
jgi:hypothetical protein